MVSEPQAEDVRRPTELIVRPARAEDREAVLAFCAHTWEDGDYIADVWDAWLHDTRGILLVGAAGDRPVALAHVAMLSDDEAWIEGVRVDPAERRQGIGRVLISRSLVAARERGANVARFFTSATNIASQQLFAGFGFVRVAEMVQYEANPATTNETARESGVTVSTPNDDEFEGIWEWLTQASLLPLTGGLEFLSWSARALNEPHVREYLAAHQIWLLREWGTIQALAIAVAATGEENEPVLQVRYLDGNADALGRMGVVLRQHAVERGFARVTLWLPDLLILHDAMDGAGYTRPVDFAMLVYARDL